MADEPVADDPMMRAPGIDPPTIDEQMAEIRFLLDDEAVIPESAYIAFQRLIPPLLAEVERLRAREAAAMAIVRAVAQNDMVIPLAGSVRCVFWDCEYDGISDHSPNCPWMKARALLAEE